MDLARRPLRVSAWLFLLACITFAVQPASAATPTQINDAVAKGVKYLYSKEKNGNWEVGAADPKGMADNGGYSEAAKYGGLTAISTYALLAAGEKPKDSPNLQAAIKWLMKAELRGTYAVALRSQVWLLIDPSAGRDAARDADAQFLINNVIQKGPGAGFYGYNGYSVAGQKPRKITFGEGGPPRGWFFDRSNSQYGVLGVWAAEQAGADVPQAYWEMVDKAWRAAQQHDGGWTYTQGGEGPPMSTPTMTCAGVASLFITQDYLLRLKKWEPCTGGTPDITIEKGLAFVEKHINELVGGDNYYGAYGVERIGTASGRRYFGSVDWFQMGADHAIQQQNKDSGEWGGKYGPIPDTCFAMLFLSRGRSPLIMEKLQYTITSKTKREDDKTEEADPWNERPRDVANLAHWVGPRMETNLNWQIVNLSIAPEQLHDAPILYISGNQALSFTDDETSRLRAFVEQGGMILGVSDCSAGLFTKSFQKLGTTLFGREFRPLAPGHLIFTGEQYRAQKWKLHPRVMGLTNGVRELMILLADGDAGRSWQMELSQQRPEFFELGANIFLYATDRKNLFYKGEPYIVLPNSTHPSKTLKVARIQTDGNWDPEPGGWRRLSAIFHNTRSTELVTEPVKLGAGKLAGHPVAHLTGTAKVIFNDAQRQELKAFVTGGGTLIIDAAGGDAEFANSIETELRAIFGKDADVALARPLPMDSPVFSAAEKITEVHYRLYTTRSTGGNLRVARVDGIPVGNRIGVFYSREDISGGLVGESVDGIIGYEPATATQLMTNMIAYAEGSGHAANAGGAQAGK